MGTDRWAGVQRSEPFGPLVVRSRTTRNVTKAEILRLAGTGLDTFSYYDGEQWFVLGFNGPAWVNAGFPEFIKEGSKVALKYADGSESTTRGEG